MDDSLSGILGGLGTDVAGAIPGGSDIVSALTGPNASATINNVFTDLQQQLQGAAAGAAAGAQAVQSVQQAKLASANPTSQTFLLFGIFIAIAAVLVLKAR